MLRDQTSALQSVPRAVRARRLDELLYCNSKLTAGAIQQDQAYLDIISSPDDVTILEVSMHTRSLQVNFAHLCMMRHGAISLLSLLYFNQQFAIIFPHKGLPHRLFWAPSVGCPSIQFVALPDRGPRRLLDDVAGSSFTSVGGTRRDPDPHSLGFSPERILVDLCRQSWLCWAAFVASPARRVRRFLSGPQTACSCWTACIGN